jgi:6-pyruvoyltetrahydropterin/6-carboxytetrahydropterin synthase
VSGVYEATILRTFSAAHAIRLPDGSLEPLHGHNWTVELTVAVNELDEIETVIDFHELERTLDELVATVHNRNLNAVPPFAGPRSGGDSGGASGGGGDLAISPPAERVARWLADETAKALSARVRLVSVKVGEAPGCWATYRPGA